jgi:dipeptidyl aminopeptidase/acylaminoacyl peptidase
VAGLTEVGDAMYTSKLHETGGMMPKLRVLAVAVAILWYSCFAIGAEKPLLTLDEFFNSVDIAASEISPDGRAVVVETLRADWEQNRFRSDLWLYRDEAGGLLMQLTQAGHDRGPQWSPDGRWIAFLSDRKPERSTAPTPTTAAPPRASESRAARAAERGDGISGKPGATRRDAHRDDDDADDKEEKPVAQVYLISTAGGEAFALTHGEEEVHAFAWSWDSKTIYFATRTPWTKEQQEAYKGEWKDVIQFRESERGDEIFSLDLTKALERNAQPSPPPGDAGVVSHLSSTPYRVHQLAASPDGRWLGFITAPPSERQESMDPYSIYLAALPGGQVSLLHHGEAVYESIRWASDSRHVFFSFLNGSVEGPYQDAQPRVYWVEVPEASAPGPAGAPHPVTRWAAKFSGALTDYAVLADGGLLAAGMTGTEVQPYTQSSPTAQFLKQPGWAGTYQHFSAAAHSGRVAFVCSSLERPAEVYLAEGPGKLEQARPITAFNKLFTQRALPQGKPYRWTADDGVTVEGMLIYPPGRLGARHLRTLALIHGGPEDADGNHFEADWYQWAALAGTNGWLVFEPNYRGSIGYGDDFALGIIPHIVSRPGKDILEGVDALVKDGIADPDHLTLGGYSYGGYMTNWLITQTTRFKAAVSGAGAVEHVANWGNDDTTFDDAYFLGGLPWQAEKNWNAEAAIWPFNKVRTPTHVVGGEEDIRVYVGEDYLLERALHAQGIPTSLLIFPGEGHDLDKNPWHGKIKVREELKWLEKYGGK